MQGTLKNLAGEGGLVGTLVRMQKNSKPPESILETFTQLFPTVSKDAPAAVTEPSPSSSPQLPVVAWNIYLSALFRTKGRSLESTGMRRHALKVLQELEVSGKSDMETCATLLEALSEGRNWGMLRSGRAGSLPFGEHLFTVAVGNERYSKEKVAQSTMVKLWRARAKLYIKVATEDRTIQVLQEARTKCPLLFQDPESMVELVSAAMFADNAHYLSVLFGALGGEMVVPVERLHRIFCSVSLMTGSDASEMVMRWLFDQGVLSEGSPIWDEASALRVLDWCQTRMSMVVMIKRDEGLVEALALSALRQLTDDRKIRQEYFGSFVRVVQALSKPSLVTKMILEKYVTRPSMSMLEDDEIC